MLRTGRLAAKRVGVPLVCAVATLLAPSMAQRTALAATIPQATAGAWSMAPIAATSTVTARSSTSAPLPIDCTGTILTKTNPADGSDGATATGLCDNVVDTFAYSWTWIDETNGTVLLQVSGSQPNTASVGTSSGTGAGTVGQRAVKLCFTTTKSGYDPATACLSLVNV